MFDLARGPMATIPPRYLRPGQDSPIISDTSSFPILPVIDLRNLLSADLMNSELDKLHSACKEWGFFQLINHGVSSELLEEVKRGIDELFKLPFEEKQRLWQEPGDMQGFGQHFVVSEDQKLDWADIFCLVSLPSPLRNPNLFSKLPITFRDTVLAYLAEVRSIVKVLLGHMAKALKMTEEEMKELFEGGMQTLRANYYPPCPQPELVIGLTPHSDAALLTVLLQLRDVQGLQIRKDGIWIPVRPLPDAFIVNAGDSLEIATNGIYKSIQHRAVVNSERERVSIAVFHSPNMGGELGPAHSLITPQTPAQFKRVRVEEYYKRFMGSKLDQKSNLDAMRIQSSCKDGEDI
ncbi:unnamed protein product [Thlaspi arvense]|uniref:Fe2OG dioxygenase domain-containing protein n=1 Tax=Thlaspi arvense TaxID=13288 RepID=A0AAU9RGJ7_THLAR|nr:unnamed protein product [Thlaspi arvense]